MDVTLETDETDLFNRQIALEADMLTGGVQRFRKARDRAIETGRESTTQHGRAIIANLVELLHRASRSGWTTQATSQGTLLGRNYRAWTSNR